jgi:hypothetical protein
LQLDDLRGGWTSAQADLKARRDRRLLGRSRARHHNVLVQQILKLKMTPAKTSGAGVGQVVGDGIQIELLGLHSARGGVQRP